jgi:hypothetical protein
MDRVTITRAAIGALLTLALLAEACTTSGAGGGATGSGATGSGATGSGTTGSGTTGSGATGAAEQSDPLVGIWEGAPITLADVDANLRKQFPDQAVNDMEAISGCLPKQGETHVTTLHFGGGQLVVSDAKNGGPSREGWTGAYAVQDANSFAAGDPENLYITVDYTLEGDRLFTDLIQDRFPDHTPWVNAVDGQGSEDLSFSKPMGDRMCAVAMYESTPFTKAG